MADAECCIQGATWDRIEPIIHRMKQAGKNELTVLVMGKPGSGVSSTVNALLGERTYDVRPSLGIRPSPEVKLAELSLRTHDGFLLRIVHTRWLVNSVRCCCVRCPPACILPECHTRRTGLHVRHDARAYRMSSVAHLCPQGRTCTAVAVVDILRRGKHSRKRRCRIGQTQIC